MLVQRTIKSVTRAVGVGLHSGQRVELTLRPAPAGTGIVFSRIDLVPPEVIPVSADAVFNTRLASVIGREGARVSTIEHIMSACSGLGIDNLYIDLTAEEVPILDGSAAGFVYLLRQAGVQRQAAPKQFVRVLKPVTVRTEGVGESKWARLSPFHGFRLNFQIDFSHPAVDSTGQAVSFDMSQDDYVRDISRARTFGFTRDVETLRANGLALGGGYDNAIVLDDYKVLNQGGLRYEDEFAKHKILDAIGDLYVLGKSLLAEYTAYRSGHALNNQLLRALLAQQDAWDMVSFEHERQAPAGFGSLGLAW